MAQKSTVGRKGARFRLPAACSILALAVASPVSAANYFATFSGVLDTNYYSSEDGIVDLGTGPFTTTLRIIYPLEYYEGPPEEGYYYARADEYFGTDPILGPAHIYAGFYEGGSLNPISITDQPGQSYNYYPDVDYSSFGQTRYGAAILTRRSLNFILSSGEGSDYAIGVTSLADIFPTIDQPTPIDIDVGAGTGITGTFQNRTGWYKETQFGFASGYITHLTVSVVPDVPEPATWAMMLVGFGAIGFASRTGKLRGLAAKEAVAANA